MSRRAIRIWFLIYKWSSLISTAFLLMLCVTGLPLIFHDEIDAAMGGDAEAALAGAPSAEGGLPLDMMMDKALAERPGEVPLFMAFSQDSSLLTVTTGPAPDAPGDQMTLLFFDRATGASLGPAPANPVMDFLLELHTDMFLGLPGMWVLGVMGLLFVVALISGVVLYAPFMRKLDFGTIRRNRNDRVRRLDQHNLFGIVALAWMMVIGLTGAINAFADPLTENWQNGEVAAMTAAYAGVAPSAAAEIWIARHCHGRRAAGAARSQPAIHRLPRRGVVIRPSLRHLLSRRSTPYAEFAHPRAGRCGHGRVDRCAHHACAQSGADDVQTAALWRLRWFATEDRMDLAHPRHDLGAVDRIAAVAAPPPRRD